MKEAKNQFKALLAMRTGRGLFYLVLLFLGVKTAYIGWLNLEKLISIRISGISVTLWAIFYQVTLFLLIYYIFKGMAQQKIGKMLIRWLKLCISTYTAIGLLGSFDILTENIEIFSEVKLFLILALSYPFLCRSLGIAETKLMREIFPQMTDLSCFEDETFSIKPEWKEYLIFESSALTKRETDEMYVVSGTNDSYLLFSEENLSITYRLKYTFYHLDVCVNKRIPRRVGKDGKLMKSTEGGQ